MNNIWKYIERLFAAIGNVVLRQPLAPLRGKMPVGQKGVVLLSFFVFVSCSTNLEPGEQLTIQSKPAGDTLFPRAIQSVGAAMKIMRIVVFGGWDT